MSIQHGVLQTATVSPSETSRFRFAGLAGLVFVLWTLATFLLEGRINLLQHPTPIGRLIYVGVANILIGIGLSTWVIQRAMREHLLTPEQFGFRSPWRTVVAMMLAGAVGLAGFGLLNPPSLEPVVVLNLFAQVLTTSIAEVLVCWVLAGVSVESPLRSRTRLIPLVLAIVAADGLFGVYHVAHSAPFNQLAMVVFLMIPGLVTSIIFFLGRDVYAAILMQNFLGMIGVGQSIDLGVFRAPHLLSYVQMVAGIVALIAVHMLVAQRERSLRT